MSASELRKSLSEYNEQLNMIKEAINAEQNDTEKDSLLSLQSDLNELIHLTQESLDAVLLKASHACASASGCQEDSKELDDEYALFMAEMTKTGAYDKETDNQTPESSGTKEKQQDDSGDSDIEEELATLLGMKCAVYHTHAWGGQPSLHNAMVCSVVPHQNDDTFKDLQVRVLFTHPTHSEMLPCPFYLDGECKFNDEQCRYSHGTVVQLSELKESIEPNFETLRAGNRILVKLRPPDGEDTSLTRKSSEKYHLWHRAVIKSLDTEKQVCLVKLEHGIKSGEKRKSTTDEISVQFEDIFPLNNDTAEDTETDDSLSDSEYPESKLSRPTIETDNQMLLIEQSLESNSPAIGQWERHTRGIGSKLMLAMGYVAGTGLGAAQSGRLLPVEARRVPLGRSLDHCLALSERAAAQDPLKLEQKLKRMQKKEEERNKRAYEREKEREQRNIFNFLNRTLGDKLSQSEANPSTPQPPDIKQSTSRDLNIEQFKVAEEAKRLEREITKLNSSLQRQATGTTGHRAINMQIVERNKELHALRQKEQQITKEQCQRKDKKKMTIF